MMCFGDYGYLFLMFLMIFIYFDLSLCGFGKENSKYNSGKMCIRW